MSNDLLALWAAAQAAEPDDTGLLLKVKFDSPATAKAAAIDLYKLRKKVRQNSKRDASPDDPHWDTSPWDHITIRHPGANRNGEGGSGELHFYLTGHHGRYNYVILPKEVEAVTEPAPPRKRRKRKED